MDTNGGRLTDEGWRSADRFFIRPIQPPREKVICVLRYGFSVWDPNVRGNTAEIIVGTAGKLWKIDPSMRLEICSDEAKDFWLQKLVLANNHWEFGPDHRTLKQVTGSPEWRFEKEGTYVYITTETAIRYLTSVRDNTTDSVIERNIEKSLETLQRR